MTFVLLGNISPVNADGTPAGIGNTITQFGMREGWDDEDEVALALSTDNDPVLNQINEYLDDDRVKIGVLEIVDAWQYHAVPGDLPEWVESDDKALAEAVSGWFSIRGHECTVGRPAGWDDSMSGAIRQTLANRPPIGGGSVYDPIFEEEIRERWREHNLLTNGGRDALHAQHLGTSAPPATFNYMAIANSATATAPNATDTVLTGEITTAGGGLLRVQATYAHTAGTNTSTLTKTYTCNGSDTLPVTVSQIGVFNASSSGTMGYKTVLGASATLSLSGDNVAITHTITAG